jgi:hypothetical protein
MISAGSVEIPTGGKEPIEIQLFNKNTGAPLLGSSTVEVSVRRIKDDLYLDWDDDTIKAVGAVGTLWQALDEIDSTNRAGLYQLDTANHVKGLDTSKFTGADADDIYEVTLRDSASLAADLPSGFEIKTGALADKIYGLPSNVADAVWDALQADHKVANSFGDMMRRIVALQKEHYFIDNTNYNNEGLLLSGRIRLFETKAAADAAGYGNSGEGEFATYTLTTTPKGARPEQAHSVKSVRDS